MARRQWCEDSVCWLEPRMSGSPCLSGFGLRGIGIGEGRRRPRENIVGVDVGAHGLHAAPALRLAHGERLLDPVREPSSSNGLHRTAWVSSWEAPANSLKTRTPLPCVAAWQTTYSLATRFIPSFKDVTRATSARR